MAKSRALSTLASIFFLICFNITNALDITALSAILIDADTGKVLWSKNPDVKRPPASTTKILTCMLLLEHKKLSDILTATTDVNKVEPTVIGIEPGEKLSAKDCLYASIVKSANDASQMIACNVGGSVKNFAKMCNERAAQIGCKSTHFSNPHGLPDPNHYSTARDLAQIAREAMRLTEFRTAVSTKTYTLSRTNPNGIIIIRNTNKLLANSPNIDGIKTGYTRAAGPCLVASSTQDGHRVIGVVLNCKNRFVEMSNMLNWAFQNYKWNIIVDAKHPLGSANIINGENNTVPVGLEKNAYIVISNSQENVSYKKEIKVFGNIKAPIKKGMQLGLVNIKDSKGDEQNLPLVALENVPLQKKINLRKTFALSLLTLFAILVGGTANTFSSRKKI